MLSRKEKMLIKEREMEEAKANAEFEAKMTAKQERKKVEKTVVEMDGAIEKLLDRAATAKVKGYTDVYRSCVSMLKVARVRKRQAEIFLFQMETMQEMQSLSKNSAELLNSMGNVMNSLGKLSLDKSAMMSSQRDFMAVQRELDRQTGSIESFLSGMELQLPDDDYSGVASSDDAAIDAEIDAYINRKTMSGSSIGQSGEESVASSDDSLEHMKELLNS